MPTQTKRKSSKLKTTWRNDRRGGMIDGDVSALDDHVTPWGTTRLDYREQVRLKVVSTVGCSSP